MDGDDLGPSFIAKRFHLRAKSFRRRAQQIGRKMRITLHCQRIRKLQNLVSIVELAADKQAATVLMPVSARRALNDLPDEYWTKTNVEFYSEPTDGVFKALME